MANVIARIRLAKGETGYYDEKSGIFLNWSHPEADVLEGTDCSGLRLSRRCHRIKVLSGSLGKPKSLKRMLAESKAKRLGVPVEHVLHKGKKQAVYVHDETPTKTENIEVKEEPKKAAPAKKAAPKVEAPAKEKADEMKAEEAKAVEAPEATAEAPMEEEKTEDKPKKTARRRRTAKKADDKADEDK